jgi:hypothetical protein
VPDELAPKNVCLQTLQAPNACQTLSFDIGLIFDDDCNGCFGVCLVRPRRELCVRWQSIGHKDEEAVLCVNGVTSYPVPRSTRRTGVFL